MNTQSLDNCEIKTSSLQIIFKRTCSNVSQAINDCRDKVSVKTSQLVASAKFCGYGQLIGRCNFDLLRCGQRCCYLQGIDAWTALLVALIILMVTLGLFLIRLYHHTVVYGKGNCDAGIMWSYSGCKT